ncbi:MAG: HEAT repeat domain-containing protein [Pirellulales bacterium]
MNRSFVAARRWPWGVLAVIVGGWLWGGLTWVQPAGADDAPAPRTPREGAPAAVAPAEPAAPVRTPAEWVREMESGDDQRIAAATAALEALGPRASAVVPDLIRLLERDEAAHRRHVLAILRALGPAGKEALPAVRAKLFHADFHVQYWACRALAAMGGHAAAATGDLRQLLAPEFPASTRRNAALALGRIAAPDDPATVEALIGALRDRNHPVRVEAAVALGALGKQAQTAVPELRTALVDRRRDVRVPAAQALWRITAEAGPLLPVLVDEIAQGSLPWEAAALFVELGEAGGPAVGQITPLLKNENPEVRRSAVEALGNIGVPARSAQTAVARLLQDEEPEVVEAAQEALRKMSAPTPRSPPAPRSVEPAEKPASRP